MKKILIFLFILFGIINIYAIEGRKTIDGVTIEYKTTGYGGLNFRITGGDNYLSGILQSGANNVCLQVNKGSTTSDMKNIFEECGADLAVKTATSLLKKLWNKVRLDIRLLSAMCEVNPSCNSDYVY